MCSVTINNGGDIYSRTCLPYANLEVLKSMNSKNILYAKF